MKKLYHWLLASVNHKYNYQARTGVIILLIFFVFPQTTIAGYAGKFKPVADKGATMPYAVPTITNTPIVDSNQTICLGSSIATIQYSITSVPSTGSVTVSGLPTGVTVSSNTISGTTVTLKITGTPTAGDTTTGTFRYIVTAVGSGTTKSTGTIIIKASDYWQGGTPGNDSSWSIAANWSLGVVPTSVNNAIIPTVAHEPVLTASGSVNNITMSGVSSIKLNGQTLIIFGIFSGSNTGVLKGSSTSVLNVKSTVGTLYFDNTADTLSTFTINNGASATLGSPLNIASKGELFVGNTTGGKLNTNGYLTLLSDAKGTAKVASLPMNSTADTCLSKINGNVNVQCYIHNGTARRAWRLLTAPISNHNVMPADSIYNSWQNNGVYAAGKGTMITAPLGVGNNLNGLDPGLNSTDYSMDSFNLSNQVLEHVQITRGAISDSTGNADNKGYFVFVRGDRNPLTIAIPADNPLINNTTLTCWGALQTGDQVFSSDSSKVSSVAGGWSLIGNPYASPISFNLIANDVLGFGGIPTSSGLNNIANRFYIWNSNLTGSSGVGGYVTIDDASYFGSYTKSVGTTVSGTGSTASDSDLSIQSGEAFFVQTDTAGSASITITEADKDATPNYVYRPAPGGSSKEVFSATLSLLNADSTTSLTDGTVAQFNDNYCACVDYMDAPKLGNVDESLGLLREGKTLSIERRPTVKSTDTLFLSTKKMFQRSYQFGFTADSFAEPGLTATLVDNYTGTRTPLSVTGTATSLNFTVGSSAASRAFNRFMVVFNVPAPLPVTFTNVSAAQEGADIAVQWDVQNQLNIKNYEVEKSTDGITFTTVGTVAAQSSSSDDYSWLDSNVVSPVNYYRIISIGTDGTQAYSQVVKVGMSNSGKSAINVYPAPVKKGEDLTLQFTDMPKGEYALRLIDNTGRVLLTNSVTLPGGSLTEPIHLSNYIAKGSYQLAVTLPDNTTKEFNIIVVE